MVIVKEHYYCITIVRNYLKKNAIKKRLRCTVHIKGLVTYTQVTHYPSFTRGTLRSKQQSTKASQLFFFLNSYCSFYRKKLRSVHLQIYLSLCPVANLHRFFLFLYIYSNLLQPVSIVSVSFVGFFTALL